MIVAACDFIALTCSTLGSFFQGATEVGKGEFLEDKRAFKLTIPMVSRLGTLEAPLFLQFS